MLVLYFYNLNTICVYYYLILCVEYRCPANIAVFSRSFLLVIFLNLLENC